VSDLQPELAAALVAFQESAPTINKGRTADMGQYSYKYADLTDIWDAIRGPLKANGLAVTQSLTGGGNGILGIRTTVWHKSGQHITDTVEMEVGRRTPQQVGSQITYYKRYALSAVLGLSTEEDDDGAAASRQPEQPPRQQSQRARTDLDDALEELDDAVTALELDTGKVAAEFFAKHKKPPRHTDADTVRAFVKELLDTAEQAS
jgi:hypothetical protein